MASEAFLVVGSFIGNQLAVRIVTSGATDARIGSVKALAVGQPVRLKAHIHLAPPMTSDHRFPGAVALPAEIR